jgi:uncharacterized protein (TIGR00730 family)
MDSLKQDFADLIDRLAKLDHRDRIETVLETILRLAEGEKLERLDWNILNSTLTDVEKALDVFLPYRHRRKIAVFGSARTPNTAPEYGMAVDFARRSVLAGYMIITGAGGGIMGAANTGAGKEESFGLNIHLPYEQAANDVIDDDPKLLRFKYFFTRKLFFLRESHALAVFPGGFGTYDELMECLTLCQTGRCQPMPIVLIAAPGDRYWQDFDDYLLRNVADRSFIDPEDRHIYSITDDIDLAHKEIASFYRVYHSMRYVRDPKEPDPRREAARDRLVIRLQKAIEDRTIQQLNDRFGDILLSSSIAKTTFVPEEATDPTALLPRLILHFNQRKIGRLYQMIRELNEAS